ncbi:MAG TPA: hypothetical protein VHJ20_14160, partial [Polyangia bacterium]|nr:hypothetical protein [Polyangia bacterium]
ERTRAERADLSRAARFRAVVIAAAVAVARAAVSTGRGVVAWVRPQLESRARALLAGAVRARRAAGPGLRALMARVAAELPGERLRAKTLAATIAVVVVVMISAGVVAESPDTSSPPTISGP